MQLLLIRKEFNDSSHENALRQVSKLKHQGSPCDWLKILANKHHFETTPQVKGLFIAKNVVMHSQPKRIASDIFVNAIIKVKNNCY